MKKIMGWILIIGLVFGGSSQIVLAEETDNTVDTNDGSEDTVVEAEDTNDGSEDTVVEDEDTNDGSEDTVVEDEDTNDGSGDTVVEDENTNDSSEDTVAEDEDTNDGSEDPVQEDEDTNEGSEDTEVEEGDSNPEEGDDNGSEGESDDSNEQEEDEPFLLQLGDEDELVSSLKKNLNFLGFAQFDDFTINYDEETVAAVEYLQSYYDLDETGTVDEELLAFIDELISTPFQPGERNQETVVIKELLYILGYWDDVSGTTLYGPKTAAAVEKFQMDQGLAVSGIADDVTLITLYDLALAPLRNGMYREDAIPLKVNLELLGFGSFAKTDYFGPKTEQTVKEFQSHFGLEESGQADQATLEKIEALLNSPFQNGKRHQETITLKENLYTLGYWDSPSGTTLYASKTEKAVQKFQKDHDLPQSGIADEVTREKLSELAEQPLQNGMYREDAVTLKEDLERLGFGSFAKTDYFGPQTERTIKNFQSYYGLEESGQADQATLEKIEELLSNPLQNGQRHEDAVTLKENLYTLGYWDSPSGTTFFGNQTEKAVKKFQQDQGLPQSGIADELTREKLSELAGQPLQNGMYSQDAVTLKENLYRLGYWDSPSGTTYFGSQTEKAVKEFQQDHDLPQSGIADDVTQEKLSELAEQPLQNGMYSQDAIKLKENLERLGFGSFAKTDYFGPQTERTVKNFQSYYGLEENGQADQTTLEKIEELLSSPLQNGQRHEDAVTLKENLYRLGYWDSPSGTTLYGSQTENAVKEFQQDYDLPQSGIADDITREKIMELVQQPLQNGMYRRDAVTLKENLERLGFGSFAKTDYFGPQTERTVKDFQAYYGLEESGQADQTTLEKIEELLSSPFQSGKRHEETVTLKENLYTLGYWDSPSGTTYYGSQTEKAVKKFQQDQGLPQSGIADEWTRERLSELAGQPLQNGMYREDAISLKEDLERLGFGTYVKNDYFGPVTEKNVKYLQEYYGVPITGMADEATLAKINEVLDSSLQYGENSQDVITLKKNIKKLGYWPSNSTPTDYFGPETEDAIVQFQTDYGLAINGIADVPTLEMIDSLLDHQLNDFEEEVVHLVNVEREKEELEPLKVDKHLSFVARQKSLDMMNNDYFAHESPTYGSVADMFAHFDVSYMAAGENIALGYTSPSAVVNAWMDSEGHRRNILNSSYTHIGVGYESDFWTQSFIGN
ncbi:peptidoglycan-binding protein [Gracilibacillus lacisalsi]|uniref:peptidoglycan-binding protein n=1 Tax=Gracilibacillus lacisalsi TaxID=393087 RepID=UPI00037803BA